jgi:hypothetical protein
MQSLTETASTEDYSLKLRQASAKGDLDTVRFLLQNHRDAIDINGKSTNGNTALFWACLHSLDAQNQKKINYQTIIIELLQADASDVVIGVNKNGDQIPLLSLISQSKDTPFLIKVLILLAKKAHIDLAKEENYEQFAQISVHFFLCVFRLNVHSHLPKDDIVRVLSLGAGECVDAFILMKLFQTFGKSMVYYGIDNLPCSDFLYSSSLERAFPKNIHMIEADANNLPLLRENLGGLSFNFGLLRNPDFTYTGRRIDVFSGMISDIYPAFLENASPFLVTIGSEFEFINFRSLDTIKGKIYASKYPNNCVSIETSSLRFSFPQFAADALVSQPDTRAVILAFDKLKYDAMYSNTENMALPIRK